MKNFLFVAILSLILTGNSFAQSVESTDTTGEKSKFFGECTTGLDITLGYVPKSSINALKAGFAFNNLFFKRVGVYTSFEKGLDSNYFSNLYGLTLSLHERVYLYGGVDLFTKYGLFNDNAGGTRKEMGIGYNPWKKLVLKLGWSDSVGITFGAGIKIPL